DANTGTTTEHVLTEGNNMRLVKRLIEDAPLSTLGFVQIQRWCKAVANRPVSIKTGKPIKRTTARNCLKVIRQFIKWASRNYGWTKPTDWHEATLALTRQTRDERIALKNSIASFWTPEEIGILWQYALPIERMLILLGLNFGYAQREISDMTPADVSS